LAGLGFGDRQPALVATSALPPLGLSDFDLWILCYEFLRNERDSHAPTRMNSEHPAEFGERQFLVVDLDGDLSFRATVVDDATEHVAARDPLIAVFVIVDLFFPQRFFDDRLVSFREESVLRLEDVIVQIHDFGVGHRCDLRSNG
jgi:hypothetical protein